MYLQIKEPTERISKKIITVWRLSNAIGHSVTLLIIGILLLCTEKFGWYGWIGITLYCIGGFIILSAIYSILFEPVFLQRHWRYSIDEEFVQLKHGRWFENHTVIPMEKVEYVRTEQGPILRRYSLYSIEIGTTASNHVIPAIPSDQTMLLTSQIAVYAKIKDPTMDRERCCHE